MSPFYYVTQISTMLFFKNIGLFKVHFLNDFGFGKVMVKSI